MTKHCMHTGAYQAIIGEPFIVTFCTGMKLHFKEPIAFGELSTMVMPSASEAAAGTFNGLHLGPDELIVHGGHVQFDITPETCTSTQDGVA